MSWRPRNSIFRWTPNATLRCPILPRCTRLGDADRAEKLYQLLLPYRDLALLVPIATICCGACIFLQGFAVKERGGRLNEEAPAASQPAGADFAVIAFNSGYCRVWTDTSVLRTGGICGSCHLYGWMYIFPIRSFDFDLVEVAPVGVERVVGFFVIAVPQLLAPQQGSAKLACLSARSC
jgi:hypothetical protein